MEQGKALKEQLAAMAGIGVVATTAEKSKEMLDEMVEKAN